MKIKKVRTFMDMAVRLADNSHDIHTQVGCLAIDPDYYEIIGTGYNGFSRGVADEYLPKTRPEKHPYMNHAEQNMINNKASIGGKGLAGCVVICTLSPCADCMRALYQSRVSKVIFKEKYRTYEEVKKMLDLEIIETKLEEFFVVEYKPRIFLMVGEYMPALTSMIVREELLVPDIAYTFPISKATTYISTSVNLNKGDIVYLEESPKSDTMQDNMCVRVIKL